MFENSRILIVEQEFIIALDMQRILEEAGAAQAITLGSAAEAVGLRDQWPAFCLAILAVPHESGPTMALAHDLRAAGLAVVLASTSTTPTGSSERLGVGNWISKPFADAELVAACRKAMDESGSRRSAAE